MYSLRYKFERCFSKRPQEGKLSPCTKYSTCKRVRTDSDSDY